VQRHVPEFTICDLPTNAAETALSYLFHLTDDAALGGRTLTVTTGAEVVSLANAFTVSSGAPMLLTVSPNTGQQGQQNLYVQVTGQFTNFVQGTTLASFGAGVTVNSVTVANATGLTANISIAANAVTGAHNLTVTTGTEVVSLASAFAVTWLLSGIDSTGGFFDRHMSRRPDMIYHYVKDHGYGPPQEFIDALMEMTATS